MFLINKLTSTKEFERNKGEKVKEIVIAGENGELNNNLFDFCNDECKKRCNKNHSMDEAFYDYECGTCIVAYMYYHTVKLCELEHSKEGIAWQERNEKILGGKVCE